MVSLFEELWFESWCFKKHKDWVINDSTLMINALHYEWIIHIKSTVYDTPLNFYR